MKPCNSLLLVQTVLHFVFRYKYLIQDILDSHSPGIPIEIPFKSCSTRLRQLLIALLLPVEFRDYLRVRLAPRLKRQDIAVLAISHRIRYSSRIGDDHGHAESVGLPDNIRNTVSSCRQNEEVGHGIELLDLACLSLIVFIQERDDLQTLMGNARGRRRATDDQFSLNAPLVELEQGFVGNVAALMLPIHTHE